MQLSKPKQIIVRLSSSNPWMLLLALIVVIVVIAVAWYLISPLFIDMQVNEGFPTLAPMPSKTPKIEPSEDPGAQLTQTVESLGFDPAQATAEMEIAMTAEPILSEEDMPEDADQGMTIIAQGEFYGIAHNGMGTATLYELADGALLLRFENFEVLNGPQLHVYLAPQDPILDSVGVGLKGILDLGPLKGNIGDQNYTIPAEFSLDAFQSVVIWCVPFRIPFNAAPLSPQ